MIINQERIFLNPMFLLLCAVCEMVGVKHNYYNYSILKRQERCKLKTLSLSLTYTTTIHTLCIEHMYMKSIFQQGSRNRGTKKIGNREINKFGKLTNI